MPSSPKIPKEKILDTALEMLIAEGWEAISIKAVAARLGTSTQPISWQFGSMEAFRTALAEKAAAAMDEKLLPKGSTPLAAFLSVGQAYVDAAIDTPKLFAFVCMGGSGRGTGGSLAGILNSAQNAGLVEAIAASMPLTSAQAGEFLQTMVIYTHGMAALLAGGVFTEKKAAAHEMLKNAGVSYLTVLGMERGAAEACLKEDEQDEH